ncbi:hypothetical protein AgCh_016736 [Apium graveolens]
MAQIEDEEPALLLANRVEANDNMMLLNEKEIVPKLNKEVNKKYGDSNVWYLDNGANNHMTGEKSKFRELNEKIRGHVKFGDGSTVKIEGKRSIILKCINGEERTLDEHTRMENVNFQSLVMMNKRQMVHRPIQPSIAGGNKYFFLLVDEFSRAMWVYMLKNKDGALGAFKRFRCQVEDGCERKNGIVERRNRTIVEMDRSLLKETNFPAEFWGEAIRHSVCILNRLPTRALSGQTPYEVWTGVKPNIGHIRVFSCIAHMKIPSVHTKKMDDRSKRVVNFGKEPGTKAYRLYDPICKQVHVSQDVFEEIELWPSQLEKCP